MEPIDLKQLHAESIAYRKAEWDGAVEASRNPEPMETRTKVWDGERFVMAPADPAKQAAFMEAHKASREADKARAAAEAKQLEEFERMDPIERAKLPDALRQALGAKLLRSTI